MIRGTKVTISLPSIKCAMMFMGLHLQWNEYNKYSSSKDYNIVRFY